MRNWKVIKWEDRPEAPAKVPFTCVKCGNESMLEVCGTPLAQVGDGILFDIGGHSLPEIIECPHCRRRKEIE